MLKISAHKESFTSIKADVAIVFVINKNTKHKWIDQKFLHDLAYQHKSPVLHQQAKTLYIPLGSLEVDSMREAGATAIKTLKSYPFKSAKIGFYTLPKSSDTSIMAAFTLGALLGDYSFDTFLSKKQSSSLREILISLESYDTDSAGATKERVQDFSKQLDEIKIITKSVNITRDLVNTPPQIATPKYLANYAQDLIKGTNLSCKILKKQELKKEKMGAYLAVAKASSKSPRLIHLSYKPKNPQKKVVLVGKGLTYDSGGLSLKPSDYMTTMKADKSGGCAVLGIMLAAEKLGLPLEIHGIIGACENMIGGNAYKPDDVLISREGKSIEIGNTDAEGRLVLADCLSYAQDLDPDVLIDFATLTGACVVGLGEYTSGVMGYNQKLQLDFTQSALDSGELVAILPFNRHIKKLIESKIADVSNVSSSRYGGAISAGMFLGEFIRESYKDKWLHIDIAGPAFVAKEWDINPYGASGAGVRMGVRFLQDISKISKARKQ